MSFDVDRYHLKVKFTEPVLGSAPSKEVATKFLFDKAREAGVDDSALDEEFETLQDVVEQGTTTFHRDEDGNEILWDFHVLGFLKHAGNILNRDKSVGGVTNLRNKIGQQVKVVPRKIVLNVPEEKRTGEYLERSLRAQTARGPRTALARSEQVPAGTTFECELRVVKVAKQEVTEDVLRTVLDYGEWQGFGQWRSGGYGRFEYELERIS